MGARRGIGPGGLWIGWGDEPGVLTPRGRYLQQHGTNQRVNGSGAGVAHALEAPEHEPALRENGEEVEHGGSGKGARPAPGTEAAIAPTSCCAKRGTRHTSGPGNRLSRTSAQSLGFPTGLRLRARGTDVARNLANGRPGRGSWAVTGRRAAYSPERRGPEWPLANGCARRDGRRRGAVTARGRCQV